MKNTLPSVYRSANFLALSIKTGIYKVESPKQNVPKSKQTIKPIILCIRLWKIN